MNKILDEGNLQFDFSSFSVVERFDDKQNNTSGLKSVDFVVESADSMFFIEVKDFQNPRATEERRKIDYQKLAAAGGDRNSQFIVDMGAKIKDSILRKYALGEKFTKKVIYLLFINLDKLGEFERGLLKAKINGHIPTGMNADKYRGFTYIEFDLADIEKLRQHGILCTVKEGA